MRGWALVGLMVSLNLASGQPLVEAWRLFYGSGVASAQFSLNRRFLERMADLCTGFGFVLDAGVLS